MDSSKSHPALTKNVTPVRVVYPDHRLSAPQIPVTPGRVVYPDPRLPAPQIPAGRPIHYPQPNFDDSLKSMSPPHDIEKNESDDQMSVISTTSSLGEMLGNSQIVNSSTQGEGSRRKKNTSKVVPSRYMQSASKFKISSSNHSQLNKSTPMQTSLSTTNSSRRKGSSKKIDKLKSSNRSKPVSIHQTPMTEHAPLVQQTPIVQQPDKGTGKTSTPTHDDVSFIHNIDTSAIASANISTLMNSVISNGDTSIAPPVNKMASDRSEKTQVDLDMDYCEYLQWLYLRSSLDKAFHLQENNAMAQITSLWNETEKLRKDEQDLKSEIQQCDHANKLDEQLDLQRSGLGPVIPNLKQLGEEHRVMAHALDTTRHQITTRGIHLPVDHDNFQEGLTSALNESEMLLGQLSMMTRQDQPKLAEYSRAIEVLKDAVGDGGKVLGQCQELMAATEALTIAETSLRIQSIQTPSGI